jgi:HD-GYP domain-containing protein (c-di-GMP phosphodiesterase class II)
MQVSGNRLPTSTQITGTLWSLLGDPEPLDRIRVMNQVRSIDPELWNHARQVAEYVEAMTLSLTDLSGSAIRECIDAAWLHDIGKLTLPGEMLLKAGPLTDAEWVEVREHPSRGAAFLERSQALVSVAPLVRQHHEWHDGRGYPDGIAGNRIELGARLIGVSDAYDAMTSWRSYRPMLSADDAIHELTRCAGTQFGPQIVDLFVRATAGLRRRSPR